MNPLLSQQTPNIGQLFNEFRQNPGQILAQLGIPQNIQSPQQAVQWLLQSGKITQAQLSQAQAMLPQIQRYMR